MGFSRSNNPKVATKKLAILGDSTANNESYLSPLTYAKTGPFVWAMCFSGWPFEFQPADNFGVGGATTQDCINNQLPLMFARHATQNYQYAWVSVGTNGINDSVSKRKSDILQLLQTLKNAGIHPITCGIRPRGNEVSLQAYQSSAMAVNSYLMELSLTGLCDYIDVTEVYANTANAFGNALVGFMTDYIHPNGAGAVLEGRIIADYLIAKGFKNSFITATQPGDLFHRDNNPGGAVSPNPILSGGTTAPTGFSTSGGTWGKTNRTLPNGQVRSDAILSTIATGVNSISYTYSPGSAIPFASPLPIAGDLVEARAIVNLNSIHNVNGLRLNLIEQNGEGSISHVALGYETGLSTIFPDGNYTFYIKTPAIPIRNYVSGTPYLQPNLSLNGTASSTGTMTVKALEMRKVR